MMRIPEPQLEDPQHSSSSELCH